MKRITWAIAAVLFAAGSVQAEQVIVNLDNTTGCKLSTIYLANPYWNFGSLAPTTYLGLHGEDNPCAAVYYFPLPAQVLGKTITSASFTVAETYADVSIDNIALHRLDTPVDWEVGDGYWAPYSDRAYGVCNGLNTYYAQYDCATDTGVNWQGGASYDSSAEYDSAVGDLIDIQDMAGNTTVSWDITTLVANYADGSWTNMGFILWMENAVYVEGEGTGYRLRLDDAVVEINFSEIPEPGTLLLLGTGVLGALGVLRRRRIK